MGDWGGRPCISDSSVHDRAPFLQRWADQPQDQRLPHCGMLCVQLHQVTNKVTIKSAVASYVVNHPGHHPSINKHQDAILHALTSTAQSNKVLELLFYARAMPYETGISNVWPAS